MAKKQSGADHALVLADHPERQELRRLQQEIEGLRDHIAAADLDIETLREQLTSFEVIYHQALRTEHERIRRIQSLVQHIERWIDLFEISRDTADSIPAEVQRLEIKRGHDLKKHLGAERAARQDKVAEASPPEPLEPPPDLAERLKNAYRALARRFHPDLAQTEDEHLRFGHAMAHINALYQLGDLDRLTALLEQARGAEIDDPELSLAEQRAVLTKRRDWFSTVFKNLQEERVALEQSATCQLWRNVEQAKVAGKDLISEVQEQLSRRIERLYDDVALAIHTLEGTVSRYNRNSAGLTAAQSDEQLAGAFDPYVDKSLVRLGLEALTGVDISPAARRRAAWLDDLAATKPPLLRLVLLAYVAELSHLPLEGLEKYDDLRQRFEALCRPDEEPMRLEQALTEADGVVEFGVRRANEKLAHVGLRNRIPELRDSVQVALESLAVRREFKRVLAVLGEFTTCTGCAREIFAVPLYRTRGLDDLRASVCPLCGEMLRSYWMPRGQDVQAVLNTAFLDYEIVSEWSFALARASIAMQLVPQQVRTQRVGDLKKRFIADVFVRHELDVEPRHIELRQAGKAVSDNVPLKQLDKPHFVVRFSSDATMSEGDALETVRHRIRNRFR